MLLSSGVFEVGLEAGALLEHSPQDVDASAGECKNGLVMVFPLAPFAVIEGPAIGMPMEQKAD